MNTFPKKGAYIIFIPEDESKKVSKISRNIVGAEFFRFPDISYNKKYKIIDNIYPYITIIDDNNDIASAHNFKYFNIKYKIMNLSDKVNKLLKI